LKEWHGDRLSDPDIIKKTLERRFFMIELSKFRPYLQSILDPSKGKGGLGRPYISTQAELSLQKQTYEFVLGHM
jgi:hypothetical protein